MQEMLSEQRVTWKSHGVVGVEPRKDSRLKVFSLVYSKTSFHKHKMGFNIEVMKAALLAGIHYIDLGGLFHMTRQQVLLDEADCVTATGSDETLAAIRQWVPVKTRFLGYGHRVSFGYVTHETLHSFAARRVAASAAADIAAWDQQGCLSPHVIYVEHGGVVAGEQFAGMLAEEVDRLEGTSPRGALSAEGAAAITLRRGVYQVRAAHSLGTKLWCCPESTAWTVVYEADPLFQVSCLNRFVYVKGVTSLTQALHAADSVRGKVSTVGLAAPGDRAEEVATTLARWGVPRVCPLGAMQRPPLTWRHDGRPSLGDLVTWTDWEQ